MYWKLEPRDKVISIRISSKEWEDLAMNCTNAGKTVSDFVREELGFTPAKLDSVSRFPTINIP